MSTMSASVPRGVSAQASSSPRRARSTSAPKRCSISRSIELLPSNQNFLFASTSSAVAGGGSSQYESTSSMPDMGRAYRVRGLASEQRVHDARVRGLFRVAVVPEQGTRRVGAHAREILAFVQPRVLVGDAPKGDRRAARFGETGRDDVVVTPGLLLERTAR